MQDSGQTGNKSLEIGFDHTTNHLVIKDYNNRFTSEGAGENYKELLTACMRYGTSIIIDSDAHCEADVGNHTLAHTLLEETGFPEELIVNTSLEKAAAYIPKLKQLLAENEAFRKAAERNTAL